MIIIFAERVSPGAHGDGHLNTSHIRAACPQPCRIRRHCTESDLHPSGQPFHKTAHRRLASGKWWHKPCESYCKSAAKAKVFNLRSMVIVLRRTRVQQCNQARSQLLLTSSSFLLFCSWLSSSSLCRPSRTRLNDGSSECLPLNNPREQVQSAQVVTSVSQSSIYDV